MMKHQFRHPSYRKWENGNITDLANTVGIRRDDPDWEIEWVSAYSPQLLLRWAKLIRMQGPYYSAGYKLGLIRPWDSDEETPAMLALEDPYREGVIVVAPRNMENGLGPYPGDSDEVR